jgi:AcrR family transcriptional regulator
MPRPLVPDRRRRILDASRELLLERGWPATTVADIARRAGVGKGAVYLELPDKAAILAAVLRRSVRDVTAVVHRRVREAEDLVDLAVVYRFGVEAMLADPVLRALYLGDSTVLGDHVRQVADDRYLRRMEWLADYARALQGARVIDPDVDLDALVRVLGVFAVGLVHAPDALGATTADELTAAVGLFADVVGRGLAADRPGDASAARAAQLALLDRLTDQLDHLEDTP